MTLGIMNGTNTAGIANGYTETNTLAGWTGSYGKSIGITRAGNTLATDKTWGITTDSSKSGIESEVNSNIHYVIKY